MPFLFHDASAMQALTKTLMTACNYSPRLTAKATQKKGITASEGAFITQVYWDKKKISVSGKAVFIIHLPVSPKINRNLSFLSEP